LGDESAPVGPSLPATAPSLLCAVDELEGAADAAAPSSSSSKCCGYVEVSPAPQGGGLAVSLAWTDVLGSRHAAEVDLARDMASGSSADVTRERRALFADIVATVS
jgi:hypothetical protein